METYQVESSLGETFEITIAEDGTIADVAGPWPDVGGEFDLVGELPATAEVTDLPADAETRADEPNVKVIFHDDRGCRVCYSDGRRSWCERLC